LADVLRSDHKHPVVITAQFGLAEALNSAGDSSRAESLLRRALQMRVAYLGVSHPDYPEVGAPAEFDPDTDRRSHKRLLVCESQALLAC
jgi:hypothetical protein